jgi:hypothetical protein
MWEITERIIGLGPNLIATGSTVSDIGVELLIRPKKLPKRAEENDASVIPRRA